MIPTPIADIISNVVISLRDSGTITSITNLGNYLYRIALTKEFQITYIDDVVEITTATNGTNEFQIKAVDIDKNYFDIFSRTTLVDEVGNYTNKMPIYDFGYFDRTAKDLTEKNLTTLKIKKFPFIFLLYNFDEKRERDFRETSIDIFLIDKTKEAYKMSERNIETFPKLRALADSFVEKLKRNKKTHFVGDYNYKEIPNRENKLNEIVDVIQLTFSNIKFINCNK